MSRQRCFTVPKRALGASARPFRGGVLVGIIGLLVVIILVILLLRLL
jgi:hypothetical protein